MSYFLAPSLVELRSEVDKEYPDRNRSYDGWIGDASHQARPSDHNPDWSDGGIVRAIDVTIVGNETLRKQLLNECIGDPRVWYVISNRIIYSRTHNWAALRYTGANPHDHHVHISIMHTDAAADNTALWFAPDKVRTKPKSVSLMAARMEFKDFLAGGLVEANSSVRRIQRALGLKPDGVVGPKTIEAWAKFESHGTGAGRNKVPDRISLQRLSKGKFTVIA